MAKQFSFYATKIDLVSAFQQVESSLALQYVSAWIHESDDIPILTKLSDWDDLGINTTGRTTGAGFFLVVRKDVQLHLKRIAMIDGGIRYKYGPSENPSSIVIQPSGLYCQTDSQEIVVGTCGTGLQNSESQRLYKDFRRAFLKSFHNNSDGTYIGKDARYLTQTKSVSLTFG